MATAPPAPAPALPPSPAPLFFCSTTKNLLASPTQPVFFSPPDFTPIFDASPRRRRCHTSLSLSLSLSLSPSLSHPTTKTRQHRPLDFALFFTSPHPPVFLFSLFPSKSARRGPPRGGDRERRQQGNAARQQGRPGKKGGCPSCCPSQLFCRRSLCGDGGGRQSRFSLFFSFFSSPSLHHTTICCRRGLTNNQTNHIKSSSSPHM